MMLVLYDETGRITHTVEGDETALRGLMVDSGLPYLIVDVLPDMNVNYVREGTVLPRPVLPTPERLSITADGVDSVTFSFPEPVLVSVEGELLETPTDTLELTSDHPDVYDIAVDHWPYMPLSVQVTAT